MVKTAIITGAGRGIGKACAIGLSQIGYHCILIARSEDELKLVAEEIDNRGGQASVFVIDLGDQDQILTCMKRIKKYYPSIEVFVNNAGMYVGGTLDASAEEFMRQIEVNLLAGYLIVKELLPMLEKQRHGYIFNIASRAGKIGFPDSGAYSASKFGLVGLGESLYRKLTPQGIRVTNICPGWVNTDMARDAGSKIDGAEMIQPEDISKTLEYLINLSPAACVREVVLETPGSIV